MISKAWYMSKTIWVGIMEVLIGAGLLVADFLAVGDLTAPAFVLLGVGILKIVLRLVTDQPIG